MTAKFEYKLPQLRYDYSALEPAYNAELLELHHDKHHRAYVDGANAASARIDEALKSRDFTLVNTLLSDLAFHVSGHEMHWTFWQNMSPSGTSMPEGELNDTINRDFGGFDEFRELFMAAGRSVQGSGWAVLCVDHTSDRLRVEQRLDHQHNAITGSTPLLVMDMWEHAFYLQYRNDKRAWTNAFFELIDWKDVSDRYLLCTE